MSPEFAQRIRGRSTRTERGFTLTELLITLVVLAVVVVVMTVVMYSAAHNKSDIAGRLEATQAARVGIDMMTRDIRSAGYGADLDYSASPQQPIAYADSLQILVCANLVGDFGTKDTLAYNPAGAPKPAPLNGTAWAPPIKYRSGAEIIRWSLDANNDGVVDALDQADDNAIDARRTPNPSDYELLRTVYADSTGDVAGNNGGTPERIALVRRPAASGVPPMFTVYMKGSATPWNWASGPVPPAQLADIERVVVSVVAPAGKPDRNGQYPEVRLTSEVNSLRNIPNFGFKTYTVDGYVYNDNNPRNKSRDAGEAGLSGAIVRLGTSYSTTTDAAGYFRFLAPAGTYMLKHTPPAGFGSYSSPDSFSLTVGPATTRSFADTARTGGWVTANVYSDLNTSGTFDAGEPAVSGVKLTFSPGGTVGYSDGSGNCTFFAQTGGYSVTCTPPDSFLTTSTNPVTGTMTTGGSAAIKFGVALNNKGTVEGTVFRDNNRNGTIDAGETGINNVWVGVTNDGGITILGFAYTDASGDYSIDVPVNDPPHTTPNSIMVVPLAAFYPTTTTSIGSIWITAGLLLTGQNFGMGTFTIISLSANRVLSLATADLIEKDWTPPSKPQFARGDMDLVLGADAGGTDNISVWFNNYNSSPVFPTTPHYTRLAPNSVLCMALDTLDANGTKARPDLVTGTKYVAAGNFFIWYNQGTSGNEGYFPTTYSAGKNYKTADNGDVQSVLTLDCAGGVGTDQVDVIVGTKSPTAGLGTVEIWQSDNAVTPTFSRVETYPPAGPMGAGTLGEVTCMALADFDGDGRRDLVIGTRLSDYRGQLIFLKNVGKVTGARFVFQKTYTLDDQFVTSLACTDVDGDGMLDVVIGSQTSASSGRLEYWENTIVGGVYTFALARRVTNAGIVMSVIAADYGGLPRKDIAAGFRSNMSSYAGGVRIYFTDAGTLPLTGVDPSGGSVINMVPAVVGGDFNYGVNPSLPATPWLMDLAAGIKITSSTGALVVFIR